MSAAEGILRTLQAQDELKAAGCESFDCEDLTVCDFCGQLVCREHTEDAVRCDGGPLGPAHHYDCADQCNHCAALRAADAAEDRAVEIWKGCW